MQLRACSLLILTLLTLSLPAQASRWYPIDSELTLGHEWETGFLPPSSFRDTYAEEIGWVLRTDENGSSVLFELTAYGANGVPTGLSSWSALKSQFGN
jgi:hypothetical protein